MNLVTATSQIGVADILPSFALRYLLPSSSSIRLSFIFHDNTLNETPAGT